MQELELRHAEKRPASPRHLQIPQAPASQDQASNLFEVPTPSIGSGGGRHNDNVLYSNVIDQVRKWSVRFDGKQDPLSFIERVEELAIAYVISKDFFIAYNARALDGSCFNMVAQQ